MLCVRHLCVLCTLCCSFRDVAPPWAAAPCLLSVDWAGTRSRASSCPSFTSSRPCQKVGWLKRFLNLQALGTRRSNILRKGLEWIARLLQCLTRGFNSCLLPSFVTTERTLIGCGIPRPTVDAFCGRAGDMLEWELLWYPHLFSLWITSCKKKAFETWPCELAFGSIYSLFLTSIYDTQWFCMCYPVFIIEQM